ncbi:MAG: FAD-dependent thymidylate synthase [Verrucomicrobia bacterium]|nr:FAD-dependent thymidylate synthase [Verrucomicrobiota bacterium]
MNVTGIALVSPKAAEENPKLTPELLASVLARYSRSNIGLENILKKVDLNEADASIDRILKFVDYGHASIAGLTGGIAMAIDDVSMWLAYKLFEIAQMADGQESSTRYISMDETSLLEPEDIGIPLGLAKEWKAIMLESFKAYQDEYDRLDALASDNPDLVRYPENAKPLVIKRIRKNYALDRVRYFIPFACRTNMALVMSSRMWTEAIKHLESLPQVEAHACATAFRDELTKFSPRLVKHGKSEFSYEVQARQEFEYSLKLGLEMLSIENRPDDVWVKVDNDLPDFLPEMQSMEDALGHRANRYGRSGTAIRRMRVGFAWNNMAIAELRDLNRHRTGHRFTPLIQNGFYLPPEVDPAPHEDFLNRQKELLKTLMELKSPAYVYGLLLGSQTPFEHSTHADKFVYEAELRTGMGAHFRYAEHLSKVLHKFFELVPESKQWINEGTAEPE